MISFVQLALLAHVIVILATLAVWLRERLDLAAVTASLARAKPTALPSTARSTAQIFRTFEDAMAQGLSPDEAFRRSATELAEACTRDRLSKRFIVDVTLVSLALAPMVIGLVTCALDLNALWLERENGTALYATELQMTATTFRAVEQGFQESALLIAAFAAVTATRWAALRRAAVVRRYVIALLHVTAEGPTKCRSEAAKKVAAVFCRRGSAVLAGQASLALVVATTCAWGLLAATTDIRASNAGPAQFDGWPQHRVGTPAALRDALVRSTAGQPLRSNLGASALVHETGFMIAQEQLGSVRDGVAQLPATLPAGLLARYRSETKGTQLTVLAHRNLPFDTVLDVMRFVSPQVEHFQLLVERDVATKSAQRAQATIAIDIDADRTAPVTVDISADAVGVEKKADWALDALRVDIHRRTRIWERDARAVVRIRPSADASYRRVIDVLSAIDTACPLSGGPTTDCGLPGLGFTFVVE